jgi:uncharacterized YigZ family protein
MAVGGDKNGNQQANLHTYLTVSGFASAEIIEKKSRFIGYINTAADEQAAQAFLQEIRAKHRDATHNCYAYQAGEHDEFQRSGDDGEPAGTAGRPILEVIKGSGLKNTVVVVTRYFGGILLGTGGLVRAYSAAAKAAVDAAGVVRCEPAGLYALAVEYPNWQRLESFLQANGCMLQDVRFTDRVDVQVCVPRSLEQQLAPRLTELLGMSVQPMLLDDGAVLKKEI